MKKGIKVLIVFVLAIALAASGFWIVHRFIESKEQQESFQELAESVLLEKPKAPVKRAPDFNILGAILDDPMAPREDDTSEPTGPEVLHDLAALKEKNADCIGWIRVPGTDIDYPIMWTPNDPEHYLHLDFYGSYSDYGVPFMDARCDLNSGNLILYGHNMFDGTMFTDLIWYKEKEYADAHEQIILETPGGAKEYKVFAVCKANSMVSGCYQHTNFADDEEKVAFLDAVQDESVYYTEPAADQFITLSTCDISRRNGRVAVIGELVGKETA